MKTAVLGEEPPGQVIYHPTLLEVARHYGFTPRACAPYRAKTKGKVERPFRYVRQDFFLGRTFRNLEDLNHPLAEWRTGVANRRRHGTTQRLIPAALAEERAALHALPLGPFSAVLKLERRISRDGLVCVGGNQYSVPDTTRCRVVEVQTRATEVHIYEQGRWVAVHPLLEGRGQRRIAPGHRRYPPPATAQRRAAPEPPPLEIPGEQVACRTLEVYETIATALARQTERGG